MEKIAARTGSYLIPVGGSNRIGSWVRKDLGIFRILMTLIKFKGYIEKWRELEDQGLLTDPKSIFVPTGSGGTAAGILIGNFLTGNRHRIFLLQVADTIPDLRRDIYEILKDFELDPVAVFKNSEFIEAVGEGNGQKVFLLRH